MTLCFFLVCVCVCVSVRMQMPCATSSSPWFITSVISCLSPEDPGKVHTLELLINFVHKWSTSPNSWTGDCSGSVLTQRYKVNLMLSCLLVQTSASWFFSSVQEHFVHIIPDWPTRWVGRGYCCLGSNLNPSECCGVLVWFQFWKFIWTCFQRG